MDHPSIEDKAGYVHRVFERIAGKYDFMNTLLSFRRHRAWRKIAMERMNVLPGDCVIDVGCGTCDWTIALAEASEMGRVVGLDFSANMLAVGERKINKLQRGSIELVRGDAMALPFPDDSFDHATIGFALRNVTNLEVVLQEMKRVVKPGGQVVCLELSKPTGRFFRPLYFFYFQRVLPLLGYLFAKSYEQYRWLPESLVTFPDYKELERIMIERIEFESVWVKPLTGGIAALHIGKKPKKEVFG